MESTLKQIRQKAVALSDANQLKALAYIEDLLKAPQVDSDPEPAPAPEAEATPSNSWFETRTVNGYGPYKYEYHRVNGIKKLKKYHGKA